MHETVYRTGYVSVKIDKKSTDSYDRKRPHVVIEGKNGKIIFEHLFLDRCDDYVGFDSSTKDAIYWVREHKEKLIEQYNEFNS